MKVLWFTESPSLAATSLNVAGVGRGWIESLEERIRKIKNIDLAIAFIHNEDKIRKFNVEDAKYYSIPNSKGRWKSHIDRHFTVFDDKKLIDHSLEIVNDFKPDIIQIFGTEDAFGLIADKVNVPVIIHIQGLLTVYTKKWYPPGISKWDLIRNTPVIQMLRANTLMHDYTYYKKRAAREQKIFKAAKYYIGRTDWDKRVADVLSPGSKYFFGSEILRRAFYAKEWMKKPENSKTIVSTIQANIYKGLETVLETASILKNRNNVDFKWVIAGISPNDNIVSLFEKKFKKKFKENNIILAGKLKAEELLNLELSADIFLHPSHIDNSPNSVCEAMLLGMPIISTYTGGTGSLLADRKEGILIQDGDPYSMAGAILELLNQPAYARELGQNARKVALERHDPDNIVNNLLSIYESLTLKRNVSHSYQDEKFPEGKTNS